MHGTTIAILLGKWNVHLPHWRILSNVKHSSPELLTKNIIYILYNDGHWTVYTVFDSTHTELFDSLRQQPHIDGVETCSHQLQSPTDDNCGEWILMYIFCRFACNMSMRSFVNKMQNT